MNICALIAMLRLQEINRKEVEMDKITEIIPDDMLEKAPEWAKKAFDEGQFFRAALEKIAESNKDYCVNCGLWSDLVLEQQKVINGLTDRDNNRK